MKPSQTVLLLVLVVAIVFAVTFASMYVAQNKPTPQPKKGGQPGDMAGHLTFPVRAYPEDRSDNSQRVVTEFGTKGSRDFWFENTHDGEVRVGLNSRNCTCSDVVLYIAPDGWRARLDNVLTTRAVAGLGGGLGGLLTAACVEQWTADLMASVEKGYDLSEKEEPKVPAGAFGFVRLRWMARRTAQTAMKPELLSASLWMQDPKGGSGVDLQAGALLIEPLRLDKKEIAVGTMGPGDSKQSVVRLWSSTRHQLQVPKIEVTGAPFVSCSQPEPLTKADIEELMERGGPVRSGYRMTIAIREQMPDGSRIDEGAFTHRVKIRPRESIDLLEPLDVVVNGSVQGDFNLGGASSGINLGEFAVRTGTSHRITLQAEDQKLLLSLEKYPPFLIPKLSEPTQQDGMKTWSLSVEIGPNKVSGSFPRADAEIYRDSAIYLKVDGPVKRKLRIPVRGNATQ